MVCCCADGKRDPTEAFWQLEIDLEPFNSHFPKMTRPSSIGEGVKFLNRYMKWVGWFLSQCSHVTIKKLLYVCGTLQGYFNVVLFGDVMQASVFQIVCLQQCRFPSYF